MSAARRTTGRLGRFLSHAAVAVGCVLFLGGFVLAAVTYQPYLVPTDSMEPTVAAGDRVLAHRIDGTEVRRGDVVVFRDETWSDQPVVKRVVGMGGDTVSCCDENDRLVVNGIPIREPYLEPGRPASFMPFEAEVPEEQLFLLGDERSDSVDSRAQLAAGEQGTVDQSTVVARVEAVAWPPGRLGLLPRASGFADLPGGISGQGPLRPLLLSTAGGAVLILAGAAYGPLARRLAARRTR